MKQIQISKLNKKGEVLGNMPIVFSFIAALFVFVIIILALFSSLRTSIPQESEAILNETGAYINATGYTVDEANSTGFANFGVTEARNATDGTVITAGDYTIDSSAGTITNATAVVYADVLLDYTFTFDGADRVANDTASEKFVAILPMLGIILLIVVLSVIIGLTVNNLLGRRGRI